MSKRIRNKAAEPKPSNAETSQLTEQMSRMRNEGYTVLPASITSGSFSSSDYPDILNFSVHNASCGGSFSPDCRGPIHNPLRSSGHFTSTANARPTPDDIGTPGKGYIPYGESNNLPNAISLANSLLIYTAKALEFNIDTLCGLGVEPVYRYHTTVGCNENEEEIAYEHAGSYIQRRILHLRKELFNLIKDHEAAPIESSSPATAPSPVQQPGSPLIQQQQPGSTGSFPIQQQPGSSIPQQQPSSDAATGSSPIQQQPSSDAAPTIASVPSGAAFSELGAMRSAAAVPPSIITPAPKQPIQQPPVTDDNGDADPESPALDIASLHAPDGFGYRRHADLVLDDIIRQYHAELSRLERDYKIWGRTNARLREFQRRSNQTRLAHGLATDMASFYLCFPELLLDQQASKQPDSGRWKPKIVGISYRDLLTTRLEEKDDVGVSRFAYVSNKWLNPAGTPVATGDADKSGAPEFASSKDESIAAIPALDPSCAVDDLDERIRHFRSESQSLQARIDNARAEGNEQLASDLELQMQAYSPAARPCRFILPVEYHTSGRHYYPLPPYWAIFQDIYLYAANIIRDRAIRKENENMFTYVLYVHSSYLEQLTNQIDAQKTEKEKEAIKHKAVQDIKDFLSSKQNNGSTLAACTFTGPDGKDHDAFRVERIEFANQKSNADGNRLELADISGLIMFAFSCHPDLIGSTPGGASSSGGTYQREMLLIKQAMVAHMQNLLLYPWFVTRDFNGWDNHLSFRIKQRVLTTLDASKTGLTEE